MSRTLYPTSEEYELLQDIIRYIVVDDYSMFDSICLDEEDEEDKKEIEKLKRQRKQFNSLLFMFDIEVNKDGSLKT